RGSPCERKPLPARRDGGSMKNGTAFAWGAKAARKSWALVCGRASRARRLLRRGVQGPTGCSPSQPCACPYDSFARDRGISPQTAKHGEDREHVHVFLFRPGPPLIAAGAGSPGLIAIGVPAANGLHVAVIASRGSAAAAFRVGWHARDVASGTRAAALPGAFGPVAGWGAGNLTRERRRSAEVAGHPVTRHHLAQARVVGRTARELAALRRERA